MSPPVVCGTTAQFPGYTWKDAVCRLQEGVQEDMGKISLRHVQLCPQSPSVADEDTLHELTQCYPDVQFRLHANVRVPGGSPKWDASTNNRDSYMYFTHLAKMSRLLNAPAYSLHAGHRRNASLSMVSTHVERLQAMFSCPVLVEGMYPSAQEDWLLSTWGEYRWLLASRLYFALDLSHINILAAQSGLFDASLTKRLLESPYCLEVHLSHNRGRADAHLPLQKSRLQGACWYRTWHTSRGGTEQVHFSEGRIHALPPQRKHIRAH